jgi:DNA-binding response OmpR family regulator
MSDRILIVEDDTSIAELIRDYLEINGMQVILPPQARWP